MLNNTTSSPYLQGSNTVSKEMLLVLAALIPAVAASTWLFGWGMLINIVLAAMVALASEALVLWLRKRPVAPSLSDCSALVTAILLAMALPPLAPWWLLVTGVAFAIIVAKHLYGGLGYNPFNPAMAGYVMLLISFPLEMTSWLPPLSLQIESLGLVSSLTYVFSGQLPSSIDTLSMATPLDTIKTQLGLEHTISATMASSEIFGSLAGKGWEIINGLFILGGLWLIYKRVISWHVPAGLLGSLFLISLIFNLVDPERYADPLFHIFSGGALLAAFFIATDPVTGATSLRGRLIFGAGVGLLTYVIRTWGGYPDGIAFAILLMNMTAPTIDYYTQPRVFGHNREK